MGVDGWVVERQPWDEPDGRVTNYSTFSRVRTTPTEAIPLRKPEEVRMDTLLRDVRYLLRSLRSSPAFSTVVILTIAVAVGATTALD